MTMKTPEMEVVRFGESDVIVASSTPIDDKYYSIMNSWGGKSKDASIRIVRNQQTVQGYNWSQIEAGDASGLLNVNLTFNGTSFHDLIEDEKKETPVLSGYNGTWVSIDGIVYTRQ